MLQILNEQLIKYEIQLIFSKYKQQPSQGILNYMAFPSGVTIAATADKYQGVVIAQIACTLIIYIALRIIHFCMWGFVTAVKDVDAEVKKGVEDDQRKWDQDSWDIYFPIIFANHIIAIALPILYTASVFTCVLSFIHFALFTGLVIVNVFIKDAEPGEGNRTSVSRILWGLMCLINVILLVAGLVGISTVIG